MKAAPRGNHVNMASDPIADPAVAAVFAAFPAATRKRLMHLRRLIFATAAATPGVGRIEETLKWGQPSYLTPETKSGATIRIGGVAGTTGVAVFVHCQTNLIATFRALYPDELAFEGNRAIVVAADGAMPVEPLRHCIAQALTYHLRKRGPPRG